jgi:hypothetical protein
LFHHTTNPTPSSSCSCPCSVHDTPLATPSRCVLPRDLWTCSSVYRVCSTQLNDPLGNILNIMLQYRKYTALCFLWLLYTCILKSYMVYFTFITVTFHHTSSYSPTNNSPLTTYLILSHFVSSHLISSPSLSIQYMPCLDGIDRSTVK